MPYSHLASLTSPVTSICLIIALNIVFYLPTIRFGLVMDDDGMHNHWKRNKTKRNLIRTLYDRLYGVSGFAIPVEHALTLTLHTLTAYLLYLHCHSLLIALLWSVHPVNHQTAIWLNGRRYQMLNILVLMALLLSKLLLIPTIILCLNQMFDRHQSRRHLPCTPISLKTVLKAYGFNCLKLTGLYQPYAALYPFLELGSQPPSLSYLLVGVLCLPLILMHPIVVILILLNSAILPHVQPCADRYLSLPALLLITTVSDPLLQYTLLALYALQMLQIFPMYQNIQSFYSYHNTAYPGLKKLSLLKRLYPEIET